MIIPPGKARRFQIALAELCAAHGLIPTHEGHIPKGLSPTFGHCDLNWFMSPEPKIPYCDRIAKARRRAGTDDDRGGLDDDARREARQRHKPTR